MLSISITSDLKRLTKDLDSTQRKIIPKATTQALNKVANTVRATAVREVSKETGIKQKDVRSNITISKANKNQPFAVIDARKGKAVNLIEFVSKAQAKPSEGAGNPQHFRKRFSAKGKHKGAFRFKGVKARAWGKGKVYQGAFIARDGSGKPTVFKRTSVGRKKLTVVSGPSVRRTFISNKLTSVYARVSRERFAIEMERALALGISRQNKQKTR